MKINFTFNIDLFDVSSDSSSGRAMQLDTGIVIIGGGRYRNPIQSNRYLTIIIAPVPCS